MESLQLVKVRKPIVVNNSERRKKTRIVDSKNTVVTLYPSQLKPIVINVVQENNRMIMFGFYSKEKLTSIGVSNQEDFGQTFPTPRETTATFR